MLKKSLFISLLIINFSAFGMDTEYSKLEDKEPGEKATEGLVVDNLSESERKLSLEVLDEEIEKREKLIKIFGNICLVDVFFRAVETNNLVLAKYCFENKIGDIDLKNKDNQTPLMLAVKKMNLDMVKLFLENKASVHHVDLDGNNALHYIHQCTLHIDSNKHALLLSSSYYSKSTEIITLLLKYGISIDSCDNNGDTLLTKFIKNKTHFDIIKFINTYNPDINMINKDRKTAINYMSDQQVKTITNRDESTECTCVIL